MTTKKVGAGSLDLGADELEWVNEKWRLIRRSSALADAASNDWQRVQAEVTSYLDRSGLTDILQRARVMSENVTLSDALEAGSWHAKNAQRHIDDLNLFLRLKELNLL